MLKFGALCRIVRLNSLFKPAEKTYIVNIGFAHTPEFNTEGGREKNRGGA